jgi:hypothetical protein
MMSGVVNTSYRGYRRVSFTCVLNLCEVAVHSVTAHEHGLRRRHLSTIHRLRGPDSRAGSGYGWARRTSNRGHLSVCMVVMYPYLTYCGAGPATGGLNKGTLRTRRRS